MKQSEYLISALRNKALIPRYCLENIEYLEIERDSKAFSKMAVLLKCFCDIPLHKITNHYDRGLSLAHEPDGVYSHTALYGEFALAFSKTWSEQNNLLPVHYLNTDAIYSHQLVYAIKEVLSDELSISETVENSILSQLAYIKPLRGRMERVNKDGSQLINQNFYDEQEWRFIPPQSFENNEFPFVMANPNLLTNQTLSLYSAQLESSVHKQYWLNFEYDDLRYIIVPDRAARKEVINAIMELDESKINDEWAKFLLVSKILVLDEIRRDW